MRIITGIAKGRRIKAPEGMDTRPTTDRVKESLFNIISKKIFEAKVLDLFAGTGNLGLESISRGAHKCTFVESTKATLKILRENIEGLDFQDKSEVYSQDAFAALKILSRNNEKYDLIFLDPPYSKGFVNKAIKEIDELDLLSDDGIVVSEYDMIDPIPDSIGKIKIYRTEKYGKTKISFWSKEDSNG
jgi:16S rRNA (guanine966-N2)-methyltransferase